MEANEMIGELRRIAKNHEGKFVGTGEVDISLMTKETADMIEKLSTIIQNQDRIIENHARQTIENLAMMKKNRDELLEIKRKESNYQTFAEMIYKLPTCNDCYRKGCPHKPKLGQTVRYNCHLHMSKECSELMFEGFVIQIESILGYNLNSVQKELLRKIIA